MQVSAESRWFWKQSPPPDLKDWFLENSKHGCKAGGGGKEPRVDIYIVDSTQKQLGIKRRGEAEDYEVKGLVSESVKRLSCDPFEGPIEIWTKWKFAGCKLNGPTISVSKTRWLRKFGADASSLREIPLNVEEKPIGDVPLPNRGCNVELTQITLAGDEVWWTFGFEAFGELNSVENDLTKTAALLAIRGATTLAGGASASYPAWLSDRRLN